MRPRYVPGRLFVAVCETPPARPPGVLSIHTAHVGPASDVPPRARGGERKCSGTVEGPRASTAPCSRLSVLADKGGSGMASRTRRKKRAKTSSRKGRASTRPRRARAAKGRSSARSTRKRRAGVKRAGTTRRRTAAKRGGAGKSGGARTKRAAPRARRAAAPSVPAEQTTLGTLTPGLPPIAPSPINPAPARPMWGTEDHEAETENDEDEEPM